jgi:hypothetical protein
MKRGKTKLPRLEQHAQDNRTATRNVMVTAVHLATYIERGEISHHSFSMRPNVVKHLCQISVMMEAVVLENWIDVALDHWKAPVARKIPTPKGKGHKRSNIELAAELVRVAKHSYMKSLKLNTQQRGRLVKVLNESLLAVRKCFRIRNCLAHGDAAVVLTQGQRKRIHKDLTSLMQKMNAVSLQELLTDTRKFPECLEILISDHYQKWPLPLRLRQLTQLSGVNLIT